MDLNEIGKIIKAEDGKIIIVENGNPIMVITSFEEYKKKLALGGKDDLSKKEKKTLPEELREEELKVEDLPL